jgi:hypothetical protein
MHDRDAALHHQVAHVAITQLVSDRPPHGLNDDEMIEMAAFEERGLLRRELDYAADYPYLSIFIGFAPESSYSTISVDHVHQ